MWYCCLAVISLCKRCGVPYKWGFSHPLPWVHGGRDSVTAGWWGVMWVQALEQSQQAVQCCGSSQHKPSCEAEEPWAGLCVQFLFWVCRGFAGCTGTALCCKCSQPGTAIKLLSYQNSQRNSGISPPLQDRIIFLEWQLCNGCFFHLLFSSYFFPPFSPSDKAVMILWIGLDL